MDFSFLIVLGLMGISLGITIMIFNQNKQRRLAEEDKQDKSQREQYSNLTTTKCPQCAEEIKLEAKICRYCRADVSQNNAIHLETKSKEINDFEREQFQKQVERELMKKHAYTFWYFAVIGILGLVLGLQLTWFAFFDSASFAVAVPTLIIGLVFFSLAMSRGRKATEEKQERIRLWEEGKQSS